MTNTEAQKVLGTMLMRYDLTDAELEAIGIAGEALEDDWISVEEMLPPITDDGNSDYVLVFSLEPGGAAYMGVAWYNYSEETWEDYSQFLEFVTHWRYLPKGPEVD